MLTIEERVFNLTDQQALSILDSLAGEFAEPDTPEGQKAQVQALEVLFSQIGQVVDLSRVAYSNASAAIAARQLLVMMAQVPRMEASLEQWLDNPPTREAASILPLVAAPVVLTGCVVLLQIAGHVKFEMDSERHWTVSIDPTRSTPFDKTLNVIVETLASLMRAMIQGQ
jgi:hypothetical protein